jgi:hypothetical protein
MTSSHTSCVDLAELSRLEAGGFIPTIPLLDRVSPRWTPTSSS